jgi:ferrous iron transport protein B
MTFPGMGEERAAYYEDLIAQVESTVTDEDAQAEAIAEIENLAAAEELRGSYAGMIGTSMEPVSKLAGFDWRTNIAVIAGIAAKEVVVSTLGTAYSLGEVDVEEFAPLSERLANDPDWSKATALALIVFTMMYAPCFVTMVVIVKETGSRKWGAFTLFGYTIIAFIAAAITYNIASLM